MKCLAVVWAGGNKGEEEGRKEEAAEAAEEEDFVFPAKKNVNMLR